MHKDEGKLAQFTSIQVTRVFLVGRQVTVQASPTPALWLATTRLRGISILFTMLVTPLFITPVLVFVLVFLHFSSLWWFYARTEFFLLVIMSIV